ncbi:MAG: GIY-YIG nuclease family protein [Streptosporangiaceae bacterium]|jgi:hypothetical protein
MCDWPVYGLYHRIDGARMCENSGIHEVGPMTLCSRHFGALTTGVMEAMRREARQLLAEGRRTPGGIEEELRFHLGEITRERKGEQYELEGRSPVVYFAERQGYVKIGTTVNLAGRIRDLTAGGSMLKGMTAGPLTVLATVSGDYDKEKQLHRRFATLRVDRKREWFRYEGRLREFIAQLQGTATAGR